MFKCILVLSQTEHDLPAPCKYQGMQNMTSVRQPVCTCWEKPFHWPNDCCVHAIHCAHAQRAVSCEIAWWWFVPELVMERSRAAPQAPQWFSTTLPKPCTRHLPCMLGVSMVQLGRTSSQSLRTQDCPFKTVSGAWARYTSYTFCLMDGWNDNFSTSLCLASVSRNNENERRTEAWSPCRMSGKLPSVNGIAYYKQPAPITHNDKYFRWGFSVKTTAGLQHWFNRVLRDGANQRRTWLCIDQLNWVSLYQMHNHLHSVHWCSVGLWLALVKLENEFAGIWYVHILSYKAWNEYSECYIHMYYWKSLCIYVHSKHVLLNIDCTVYIVWTS